MNHEGHDLPRRAHARREITKVNSFKTLVLFVFLCVLRDQKQKLHKYGYIKSSPFSNYVLEMVYLVLIIQKH